MQLTQPTAEIYVPDGQSTTDALRRTTILAIGAHQDDLEIMAYHAILRAFESPDDAFTGVVMTNGSGSPRDGIYQDFSDADMMQVRRQEQKKAAVVGDYAAAVFMEHSSSDLKNSSECAPVDDLKQLIAATRPAAIYTHNLTDKHDTHVAVLLRVVQALRELPASDQPREFYGCEVWRALDWLCDDDKRTLDVSAHENLAMALLGVFDSQICGGKRYDLATLGRRRANATYLASHATDNAEQLTYAMDLMPLLNNPELDPETYACSLIAHFTTEVQQRIAKLT